MGAFLITLVRGVAVAFVTLITIIGSGLTSTTTPPYVQKESLSLPPQEKQIEVNLKEPAGSTTAEKIKNIPPAAKLPAPAGTSESVPAKKAEEILKIIIKPAPSPSPPPAAPVPSISEVNDLARSASVNILCTTAGGGVLNPITGSGVIIDERGVVLTNAHIGQYFLLKDFPTKDNVECVIRTGSPAAPRYRAELIFISPAWIEANKKNLTLENPLGTGENDFALLLIAGTTNPSGILPASFPALSPNIGELSQEEVLGDNYIIAGYPAGFLGSLAVLKDLFISSTVVRAKQVFTFKETTVDLLSFGGSILAQKGASGSAVARQRDKKLVGIIVTTTDEKTTGERDLRAVATTHISRSLAAETGKTLPEFLAGNTQDKVTDFKTRYFDTLKNILVKEITAQ